MSKIDERFEDEEQEKEFYKDTNDAGSERAYSTTGRPLSDPQGGGAISVADAKKAGGENILSQSERWGHDKGDHQGALGNISIISDKSGDKGEGLFAGSDKGSGESPLDKLKGDGDGALSNLGDTLEEKKDELTTSRKGSIVKVNKKRGERGRYDDGGKVYEAESGRKQVAKKKGLSKLRSRIRTSLTGKIGKEYKHQGTIRQDVTPRRARKLVKRQTGEKYKGVNEGGEGYKGTTLRTWDGGKTTTNIKERGAWDAKTKMHKGGKVKTNKKGMAIVIAIGRPKVNRKKR
tara:strand:- start:16 stop:885 length:870 start_codon:yes stop_codon:yes gene_type:complete